jgi:hypothetical protein
LIEAHLYETFKRGVLVAHTHDDQLGGEQKRETLIGPKARELSALLTEARGEGVGGARWVELLEIVKWAG